MVVETRSDARSRATEALAVVVDAYRGLAGYPGALSRADDGWQAEAVAQLAEAVAARLLDVQPRPGHARGSGANVAKQR